MSYEMSAWKPVHESVIVGLVCHEVGWVNCYRMMRAERGDDKSAHWINAINLSHSPMDPSTGDMILSSIEQESSPIFHILELKVDWESGIEEERNKFSKKIDGYDKKQLRQRAEDLCSRFHEAEKGHWYGAIDQVEHTGRRQLVVASYWPSVLRDQAEQYPLYELLKAIGDGTEPHVLDREPPNGEIPRPLGGFNIERLDKYIRELNSTAALGSKAARGSVRLVGALNGYELFLLSEYQVTELINTYRERQEVRSEKKAPKERMR